MKKKKYLTLYEKWMDNPYFHDGGLCDLLEVNDIDPSVLDLFIPTREEFGINNFCGSSPSDYYWGATGECRSTCGEIVEKFTPLRQTILLFLAAMNGEL